MDVVGGCWMPEVSACVHARVPHARSPRAPSMPFAVRASSRKTVRDSTGVPHRLSPQASVGLRVGWRVTPSYRRRRTLVFGAGGTRFPWMTLQRQPNTSHSGHMLHLGPEELLALGDWQAKSDPSSSKAAMPLHYSAARYTQSLRGKHRVLNIVAELATCEAWEMLPEEVLKAADVKAMAEVDRAVARDRLVIAIDGG